LLIVSRDLTAAFPGVEGFSPRNMRRMRAFYCAYPLDEESKKMWRKAADKRNLVIWPQAVAKLPWAHNVILLEKVKNLEARQWYAHAALEYGWSRNILVMQIESNLYERQGKAVTNFCVTLPQPTSDLAAQTLKDPYMFVFLTLTHEASEREIETGLVEHVTKFLLELGSGFAFIGRQVHLEVGGCDYFIDLLFYHVRLRCYVVIELKAGVFKPEYAGKMNFCLSAVDDLLRHPDDKSSIGIILCKDRDKVAVEYALRDIQKPMGVSRYKLTKMLPEALGKSLPTIEEIEAELGGKNDF